MAFDGLLSQIANPQMADIAGAIDFRQKRLQEEEKRQKDAKMKELMGQAIPHLREGSVLQQMAQEDPERFLLFTKAVGIPIDQASQLDQMSKDVRQISKIMSTDPEGAISYADSLAAEREKMGLDTSKIRSWVDLARTDAGKAGRAMTMLDESLNSDLIAAEKDAKRKADLAERGMKVDERQVAAQEVAARQQSAASSRPTANAQDLATYKAMKAAGDPDAEGFGRSIGIISKEGEKLSAFAEKAIADSADAANTSRSSAAKYTTLADNLRNATKMSGGLKGTWGEWIKEQTGNQDELTALRKEALGITNSEAIASLPPGPATDRDIEMAKAPFPTEKSDPKYVADWLSAVSRLQQKKAEYAEFKADFISKNGTVRGDGKSLSAAWKESQKQAAPASRFKIEVSD